MTTSIRGAWFLLFIGALPALPQPFSVGVKAGVPLTDFLSTVKSPNLGFNSSTKRYILGASAQLNLPAGFAVELDALYRRMGYDSAATSVTAGAWEFPLLLKYRFPAPVVRPFLDAGVAWDTLRGLKQSIAELRRTGTSGFVAGGGVDIHAVFLHITPEVRYTRWGAQHFQDAVNGLLHSNRNQAEFLLGITF